MRAKRGVLSFIFGVLLLIPQGFAAEVRIENHKSRPIAFLTLEGEIIAGDADRVLGLIRAAHDKKRVVVSIRLRSPGGDVLEALKLSEILNKNLISANVPSRPLTGRNVVTGEIRNAPDECKWEKLSDSSNCVCYSSCGILWLTAPLRSGDYVGVHRPRFSESYFAGLSASDAQDKYAELTASVSSFLAENEVPPEIITKMMTVSSGDIHILTEEEVALSGEGKPYVLELLRAKCFAYHDEAHQIQQLKKRYEDLWRDFSSLANSGNYELANKIGDKMEVAQDEYYTYEKSSRYPVCIRDQQLELQSTTQQLK